MIDLTFLRDRTSQKVIVAVTLACAAVGGVVGLVKPRWYQATVSVVPARQQRGSGIAGLLGGDLSSLAGGLEASLGGSADAARIGAVIQGTSVSDAAIEKFDLKDRYGARNQEAARETLWRLCSVRTLPKPNIVQVTCEDQDPRFVKELLDFITSQGNEVLRRVNAGSAGEEVRFLEKRVAELRQQADEAATRMRDFQEANKIVDLDSQARALVTSVAGLNAQRLSKQVELGYVRSFSSPDEASARNLATQLDILEGELRDLEAPRAPSADASARPASARDRAKGMLPAAQAVPRLRAEYEKLFRDRKVAEASLVFALDRLEGARAAQARDVSTFVVLDPPVVPTRKSRPSGAVHALGGAFLGFAVSFVYRAWRGRRARTAAAGGGAKGASPG